MKFGLEGRVVQRRKKKKTNEKKNEPKISYICISSLSLSPPSLALALASTQSQPAMERPLDLPDLFVASSAASSSSSGGGKRSPFLPPRAAGAIAADAEGASTSSAPTEA